MKPDTEKTLSTATLPEIFAELQRRGWTQIIEEHSGPYQETPITFEAYPESKQ